jgi:hypothetical protein
MIFFNSWINWAILWAIISQTHPVISLTFSTLKSLAATEVPELKAVGLKAASVLALAKPDTSGANFSHNDHAAKFVHYLRASVSNAAEWAWLDSSARVRLSNHFYSSGLKLDGLSVDVFARGVDYVAENVFGGPAHQQRASEERYDLFNFRFCLLLFLLIFLLFLSSNFLPLSFFLFFFNGLFTRTMKFRHLLSRDII